MTYRIDNSDAKTMSWDELEKAANECFACELAEGRTNVVFESEGPRDANLFFIGEGPGKDEDEQGRPFVGRAGSILDRGLEEAGINRDEVYISNIVYCRPPNNRRPKNDEVASCLPFTRRQIELVNPEIIVTLGGSARDTLVPQYASVPITQARGRHVFHANKWKVLPTLHPAYAGIYQPQMFEFFVADLRKAWEMAQEPS